MGAFHRGHDRMVMSPGWRRLPDEWMTITDDSLSNELERELLTSAAAMCLWQEWMVWYQGERASAFTDAFGKIGDVFVRGRSGQWSLVAIAASKLREIMRRLLVKD